MNQPKLLEASAMEVAPMALQGAEILDVPFHLIDYDRVLLTIESWRQKGTRQYVTFTNPHSLMVSRNDNEMRAALCGAGLTLPDGVGITLAARILRYAHSGRVTGPALMLRLCDWGRQFNYRHYFYGGEEGVADKLAQCLSAAYPDLQVAGAYCPPFRSLSAAEDEKIVARINATQPDIVWIGLGAPKQEKWMAEHAGRIHATALLGVGAAFNFHSGHVAWAPAWVRKCGLEWAHRLLCEPRRMFFRTLQNPVFLGLVLKQRFIAPSGPRKVKEPL
jgi:N-acetylglucosaminyldiphosphoundecaprenol N-acetyl-beta-D-mannosaminyltransferase